MMSHRPPMYQVSLDYAYLYGGGSAAPNFIPWPPHCDYMPMCQYVPIVPYQPTLVYPFGQQLYQHPNMLSMRPRFTTLVHADPLPNQFAQPYIQPPPRFPIPLPRGVVPRTQGPKMNNYQDKHGKIPTSHQPGTHIDSAATHPDYNSAMGDVKRKTFQEIFIPSGNKTYVHPVQRLRSFKKLKKSQQKRTDLSVSSELSSILKEGNHAQCYESELSRLDKQDFSRTLSSEDFTEIDNNKSYAYINYNPDLLWIGLNKETKYAQDCKVDSDQNMKKKSDVQRRKIEKFSTPSANFEKEQISRSFKNMVTNRSQSKGSLWDSIGFAELCSPVLKDKRNTSFSSPHFPGSQFCCCRSCARAKKSGICNQHQGEINLAASLQESDKKMENPVNVEPEMWWDRSTDFGLGKHKEIIWNQVIQKNDNNNNSVVSDHKNDPERSDLEFQPSKLVANQNRNRNQTYAVENFNNAVRLLTDDNKVSNNSSGRNRADPEVPGRNSAVKRRLLPVDWAAITTEHEEVFQLSHTCDSSLIERNVKGAKPSIAELDGAIVELGPVSNKYFRDITENRVPYLLNPYARQSEREEVSTTSKDRSALDRRSIITKHNQISRTTVHASHSTNTFPNCRKEMNVIHLEKINGVDNNLQKNTNDCNVIQFADSQQDCRNTKRNRELNSLRHWKSCPLLNIPVEEPMSSNMNGRVRSFKSFFKIEDQQEIGGLQHSIKIEVPVQVKAKFNIDSIKGTECIGESPSNLTNDEKKDEKEESPLFSVIPSKNFEVSARAVSTGIPKRRSPRILMKSMTSLSMYRKARNNSLPKQESSKIVSRKRRNVINSSKIIAFPDIKPDQAKNIMPNVYNTRNKRFYQTAKPNRTFFEIAALETARRSLSEAEGSQLLPNKLIQYGFRAYDSYSESKMSTGTPNVFLQSDSKIEKIASDARDKDSNDKNLAVSVSSADKHLPSAKNKDNNLEKLSSDDFGKTADMKKKFIKKNPCQKISAVKNFNKLENDLQSIANQDMDDQVNENRIVALTKPSVSKELIYSTDRTSTSGQSSYVRRNKASQEPLGVDCTMNSIIHSRTIHICPSGKKTYPRKSSTSTAMFLQPVINASLSHLPDLYLTRMSNSLQVQDANVKQAKFASPILFSYDKSERFLSHLNKHKRAQMKRSKSISGTEYSTVSRKSQQQYSRNSFIRLTTPYLQPVFTKPHKFNVLQLSNGEKNTSTQKKKYDPNLTEFRKRLQGIDVKAASATSVSVSEEKDSSDPVADKNTESDQKKNENKPSRPVIENVSPVKPSQSILQQDILCAVETLQIGSNDEVIPVKKAKGNKHKRSFLKRFISITKGKREKKEADKSVMPSDDDPVANPVRKRRLHIKKRFSSKSYSNAVKNTPSDLTIKKSSETSHSKFKTKSKKDVSTINNSTVQEKDYNENPTVSYTATQSTDKEENTTSKIYENCDTIQDEQSLIRAKASRSFKKRPKEFKTVQNALYKPTFLCMAVTEVPCNNTKKELSLPLSDIEDGKQDVTAVSSSVADWFGDDSTSSTTTIKRKCVTPSMGTPGVRINSETGDLIDGNDGKLMKNMLSSTAIGDETEAKCMTRNLSYANRKRFQHVSTLELSIGERGNVRSKPILEKKENRSTEI